MSNKPGRSQNVMPMPSIDTRSADSYHCPRCNNMVFMPVITFYAISAIESRTGKESAAAVEVMHCLGCGWVGKVLEMAKMSREERAAMIQAHNERVEEQMRQAEELE